MKEITFEETKCLLLDMISVFDSFCRAKSLRYSLAYGSLIGAVRHKGFIPWDDDIDILMPRSDYKVFANEFSHSYYQLISQENDPEWPLNYSKFSDTRTVSIDGFGNEFSIAIDVFILDGLPDTYQESEKMVAKVNRLHRVWSSQLFTRHLSLKMKYGLKKNAMIVSAKILGMFINYKSLVKRLLSLKQAYSINEAKYCASLTGVCTIYETEKMLDYIDAPFEDKTLMICRNYDYQLRMTHGDYMKVPPVEERYNHSATSYWK